MQKMIINPIGNSLILKNEILKKKKKILKKKKKRRTSFIIKRLIL